MIKIIKHGYSDNTPPKATRYRITCEHCGCVFECDFRDFRSYVNYGKLHECAIQCPECETYLNVPMYKVVVIEESECL